jgi:ketosteroid isomerase-like protein
MRQKDLNSTALQFLALLTMSTGALGFDAAKLADEEAKFALHSVRHGMRAAFIEYLSADSILLRPDPVNGRAFMQGRSDPPIVLDWRASFTVLSSSGDFGLSTGPWIRRSKTDTSLAPAFGQFFSIWRKQKDGNWRVEIDHGISHDGHNGMHEKLTVVDLQKADTPHRESDPEAEFIVLANRDGAHAAYRRFNAPGSRHLREGQSPIVAAVPIESSRSPMRSIAWSPGRFISSAARDFGYVVGTWRAASGGESASGHYIRVWVRSKDGWRIAADILTPRPAG